MNGRPQWPRINAHVPGVVGSGWAVYSLESRHSTNGISTRFAKLAVITFSRLISERVVQWAR